MTDDILLSPPHMSGKEKELILDAIDSNWIAPIGPHVSAFEEEFASAVGSPAAAATSSGTAALHLALVLAGVEAGDDVCVSTFTFSGSVNPILYQGARPVFVDSEPSSWNMDPGLLRETIEARARSGTLPAAIVVVHIYGQTANMDAILQIAGEFEIPVVEDAAEALGSTYGGRSAGTLASFGIFSFNGNKIITTSGGGMLVAQDPVQVDRARFLAAQAKEETPYYHHEVVGYNYRLSNLLAAVGRAQLEVLDRRVEARRANFRQYRERLDESCPELTFMPEAPWGTHNRWLTTLTLKEGYGVTPDVLREKLAEHRIEARRLWKPMHLQPVFEDAERVGGEVAEALFERGLCLPSGSSLSPDDIDRVSDIVQSSLKVDS